MISRVWHVCLFALTLAFVVACQPTENTETHDHDGGHEHSSPDTASSRPNKDYNKIQMTGDDMCKVSFTFEGDAEWPEREKHFYITVEVETKDGETDKDFEIEVDADMPEHGHGMNSKAAPTLMDGSKNKFKVDGMLFHMRGWWQIYVTVTKGCGVGSKATFNTYIE